MADETQNTTEDKSVSKTKKQGRQRNSYHLMLFIDKADGGVHQMGIGSIFVQAFMAIIVLALAVTITGWAVNSHLRKSYKMQSEALSTQIDELTSQVSDLVSENGELNDKVSILSSTVNTKVEQENAAQEESEAAHYPEGFPLSSSASMTTDADIPDTLIFICNSGSNILATGDGTVLEVIPDADYGYCIRIDHGNGYVTEYYNEATPLIKEGDEVLKGAVLATVENNDSKLAYRIYKDDELVDPMTVIKIDG